LHAATYLFSRRFMKVEGRTAGQLACLAHIVMGAISLALLPFFWHTPDQGWLVIAWPLLGCTGFYMSGQICFFRAIRSIEPSRVASMLGVKIAVVAVIVIIAGAGIVSPMQWAAVLLAVIAIRLVNVRPGPSHEPTPWGAYLWIAGTCAGFALSDFHIGLLLEKLSEARGPQSSAFAVTLSYILAGTGALLFLPLYRRSTRQAWKATIPFSIAWYASMMTFYIAIGLLGVVGAVILQSTRGIWAIGLGILIAHLGHVHIERKMPTRQRLIQIGGALLMCLAIGLYAAGGR
jgi:drug/metabolite transporter (DMT)-like permease